MNLNGPINGAVSSLAGIFCGMTTTPNVRDKLSAQYRRTFCFPYILNEFCYILKYGININLEIIVQKFRKLFWIH